MSKQVDVQLRCPFCGQFFDATLFRSIWIEYPELRSMVFSDSVNREQCPSCRKTFAVPFSLLATNVNAGFAVWYEPEADPLIDEEVADYETVFGPGNFYSTAPRMRTWGEFKQTIEEFESGRRECKPLSRSGKMHGLLTLIRQMKRESGKGCLSFIFSMFVLISSVALSLAYLLL